MASCHILCFFLFSLSVGLSASGYSMSAMNCTKNLNTCTSLLYHINLGLSQQEIASYYSVNTSQFLSVSQKNSQDYFIKVPCSCKDVSGTTGYFYDTDYTVKNNDTFSKVSNNIYSGQALYIGGEEKLFISGAKVPMHLLCGCVEKKSQIIVTYTVQQGDTLSDISNMLSARMEDVVGLNTFLDENSAFISTGWVLFVPKEINGIPPKGHSSRKSYFWDIIIAVLSAFMVLSLVLLLIIIIRRQRFKQKNGQKDARTIGVSGSKGTRRFSEQHQFMQGENTGDVAFFDSERPVVFSLEEIEEATNDFDETKIIGVGGYGSVFYGTLITGQEVAVKKMRFSKSKEFYAELKVLCKIHHINVVELLGYASGDDHLYLVYEYVQNGSLNEHLHDPLLKGNQPLSWTARAHIALDAAMGIEYIHDHTKALYVHRDIKTSNILLDKGLRAKVGDFGSAMLLERTSEEDLIATRLVGTPGYLPPESVKELQITPKTDVFAFGVVLAELITGQRALVHDNQERNKMKSLTTTITKVFEDEDPETALEDVIDGNLRNSYPVEAVFKMAEVAVWCLSEDPMNRPEMRETVVMLSQIMVSSTEWEASLGGDSQVFSGLSVDGR